MASPFPGMDPFLEQPAFWSSFHTRLIVAIADTLAPLIRPNYYVEVETRTYMDTPEEEILVGIPDAIVLSDSGATSQPTAALPLTNTTVALKRSPVPVTLPMPVEVKERYLEVRSVQDDQVVTVIEVLSPANKRPGKGRDAYEAKRLNVLGSDSHLVEIDLLRAAPSLPLNGAYEPSNYYILVSASEQRPVAQLYSFSIKESLPTFLMPLRKTDEAVAVNMQQIFAGVVERASYDSRIDYAGEVRSLNLSSEDLIWTTELLKSRE